MDTKKTIISVVVAAVLIIGTLGVAFAASGPVQYMEAVAYQQGLASAKPDQVAGTPGPVQYMEALAYQQNAVSDRSQQIASNTAGSVHFMQGLTPQAKAELEKNLQVKNAPAEAKYYPAGSKYYPATGF